MPWVVGAVTFLCVAASAVYSGLSPLAQQAAIDVTGAVPSDIAALVDGPLGAWFGASAAPLASSLFLHSNVLHLAGNLGYLWLFGLPVERTAGHLFIGLLFLLGGSLAHVIVAARLPGLESPIVGASGAVSAVVGAYLGLLPRRPIGLYIPLGIYVQFARVPALLVIGSWFTLQLVYTLFGPITGTVAWWTHLAGFIIGLTASMLYRAAGQFTF